MREYKFQVPEEKKYRVIVHTDCKNEADDQYALAHWLMTPKAIVKGVIAGHFDKKAKFTYPDHGTAKASYDEILKVMKLMEIEDHCPVLMGSAVPLEDREHYIDSEGMEFIIQEAMKEDPRPLYIACQGAITDLACAIIKEPKICSRMTAIWIGGGIWPEGGREFNLMQDINAANVVFASDMAVWQVPMDVYKLMSVSLAELEYKVQPCGEIGNYLFSQLVDYNVKLGGIQHWPHGELWGLGDQGSLAVLMEELEQTRNYTYQPAPAFTEEGKYIHDTGYRKIRVYHNLDSRLVLEDFFCKLALNYGKR